MDTSPQGRLEYELDEVIILGETPEEFNGIRYRILIDPHVCLQEGIPFVDGVGHICAFRIQDGQIYMKMRCVYNEVLLLRRKAGRRLFGRYRNAFDSYPCVWCTNIATANTNIAYWGGDLLVLAERGLPHALDPGALETRVPGSVLDIIWAKITSSSVFWNTHVEGVFRG